MNKYLIMRKKGEMANEIFHLKKDISSTNTFTIPWIIRKIKKISTKEDVVKYHLHKIEKIMKSRYFVVEPITKNSINDLIEICKKEIGEENGNYTTIDLCQLAEITYKRIASPIFFSVFAMELNMFEWILIILFVLICYLLR